MITKLFKRKYYPLVFQLITLTVFILLIIGSISIRSNDAAFVKQLRNTNLANLIVWSYWWPIIIITAIVFGRHWCTICPVELITTIASKFGFKKKPGKFLKSKWLITLFYALIIILAIHSFSIHRIPQRMSFYLLGLFTLSIIIGLVYEKRAFCTYVCPVGNILGLYSLLSRTGIGVKSQAVCKACKTKDCIAKKNHYNIINRSCTSGLYPPTITDNRECILCTQCVKVCPNDNVVYKNIEKPSTSLINIKLSNAETALIIVLSGFVVYEIVSMWKPTKGLLLSIPYQLTELLMIPQAYHGTVNAILLFVIFPLIFFGVFSLLLTYFNKEKAMKNIQKLSILVLPIIAFMHFAKALFKMASRIPYIEYAIKSWDGMYYAQQILDKEVLLSPNPLLNKALMGIAILLGMIGLWISINIIKKSKLSQLSTLYIMLLFSLIYLSIYELSFFFNFF